MRTTLLNMVFGSVSSDLSAVCGTCLPNGCAGATHSQGVAFKNIWRNVSELFGVMFQNYLA
jgi:hypothetical protein